MAKVINISPVDRKIGLSIREYERDLEHANMAEHGQTTGRSVDVGAAMRGSVPSSMIQAGRSLEDVAHELMVAVSRVESAQRADKAAAKAAADEQAAAAVEPAPVVEPAAVVEPVEVVEPAPVVEQVEVSGEAEAPVADAAPEADAEEK
jgi:hypothetical protein